MVSMIHLLEPDLSLLGIFYPHLKVFML